MHGDEARYMMEAYETNWMSTVGKNIDVIEEKNAYIKGSGIDVGADVFHRGLCLPSDNKMTADQQNRVIEIIHRCFL